MSSAKVMKIGERGDEMPMIGIGTYQIRDSDVIFSILDAGLKVGYRLIDTAAVYRNESMIADALETLLPKYGLSRDQIFITSKLSPKDHGSRAREGIQGSLENLRLDYVDLYLIHWPGVQGKSVDDTNNPSARSQTWQIFEEYHDNGKLRNIGVSNYSSTHLTEMKRYMKIRPSVNQCEFHPFYLNQDTRAACQQMGIHFQAYSSFGSPKGVNYVLNHSTVANLAEKYGTSPAGILLSFSLGQGISVLPRSCKPERVTSNFVDSCIQLDEKDIASLTELSETESSHKFAWDPSAIK